MSHTFMVIKLSYTFLDVVSVSYSHKQFVAREGVDPIKLYRDEDGVYRALPNQRKHGAASRNAAPRTDRP